MKDIWTDVTGEIGHADFGGGTVNAYRARDSEHYQWHRSVRETGWRLGGAASWAL